MKTYGTVQRWEEREWVIRAVPHIAMRVKRLFPRVRQAHTGEIIMLDTPEVCRDLEWLIDRWPMDMPDADRAHLDQQANDHRGTLEMADEILAGRADTLPTVREPLRAPRDYQSVAADLAVNMGRLLLVDDLGLGKTFTGLLTLRAPETLPAVVVCQTHLTSQWLDQLRQTWGDLRGYEVTKQAPYDLSRVCGGQPPDVIVVPYSKVHGWADHLADHVKTVIFDEIQELRRTRTLKYEGAARLAYAADLKVGLTATPIYNYGAETHSVISILAPGALGSEQEFVREWTSGYKGVVHSPVALGEYLRDESLMLVRTRKDVGREIDKPIRVTQHVDVDEEVFENAKGDAIEMARLILDAQSSREDRWKASGDLDWKMRHATGVSKAPFVAEFVRMLLETERKVLLFGWHRDVYDIWMETLAEFNPRLYTGSETATKKDAAKDAFMATPARTVYSDPVTGADDGECRVLIMSLRSGAGVDGLQTVCSAAVLGELDWSPKVHDQGIGRLARDGQESGVVAYFCVSDVGADPLIAEVNQLKDNQSTAIVHRGTDPFRVADNSADRVRELARRVLGQQSDRAPAEVDA